MADCLHCEINDLVQQRIDAGDTDVAEMAAMIVESLAELILLVPETEQARFMADTLAHFSNMFLEKSGATGPGASSAAH